MKSMKEISALSVDELHAHVQELQKELLKVRVEIQAGANPANPGKVKQIKKNIARLRTLLQQKDVQQKEVITR